MLKAPLLLSKGDWVSHPRMPAWGYGKILELIGGNKGRVFFLLAGEKKMSWEHAGLVPVESDEVSQDALSAQLAQFRLHLATDLLSTAEGDGGVESTPCSTPGSKCELCKSTSDTLRIYSVEKKGKLCFCGDCKDKIMLEIGDKAGSDEGVPKTGKKQIKAPRKKATAKK